MEERPAAVGGDAVGWDGNPIGLEPEPCADRRADRQPALGDTADRRRWWLSTPLCKSPPRSFERTSSLLRTSADPSNDSDDATFTVSSTATDALLGPVTSAASAVETDEVAATSCAEE